jgi:glycine hydroxymethyltransferase
VNRNVIPFDTNGAWYTSGLRLGTAAVTTLGMGTAETKEIASIVVSVLKATRQKTTANGGASLAFHETDEPVRAAAEARARDLLTRFPLYPGIEL